MARGRFALALGWLLGSWGCAHKPVPSEEADTRFMPNGAAGLPDRDPELARRLVQQGALLLDVRTKDEWQQGHLRGAKHIPVNELSSRLQELSEWTSGDKNEPIVLYCRSGARAGRAKQALLAEGYARVTNLGGIKDWQ